MPKTSFQGYTTPVSPALGHCRHCGGIFVDIITMSSFKAIEQAGYKRKGSLVGQAYVAGGRSACAQKASPVSAGASAYDTGKL